MSKRRDDKELKQRAASRKTYQKFFAKRMKFFRGMSPIWKAALFPDNKCQLGKRDAIR